MKQVNTRYRINYQQLAEELHKPIIRKFKKRKVQFLFMGNVSWAKGFRFLLCVIDICSKYAWGIPFKDKLQFTIYYNYQCFSENFKWVL